MIKSKHKLSSTVSRCLRAILPLLVLGAASPLAHALSFTFSQEGFEEGATVTGSFVGEDADSDGILAHFALGGDSELSDFNMSFSGNSLVPAFSLDFSQLDSFVYYLGDNLLGNDVSPDLSSLDFEGIAAFSANFTYVTGQGPTLTDGGFIEGPNAMTQSSNAAIVGGGSQVPDSGSAALILVFGLTSLAAARRFLRSQVG